MLGEALSYPRRGDGWLKRIGIGGLLLIFSWLIIPGILLYGYLVRVSHSAALDEETPPAFDNWGGMLVDGLKYIVISIAYFIIPYIVYFVAIFALSGSGSGISAVALVVMLIALLLMVIAAYILPVAITNFALHDSLGAAFDFGTVFNAAFSGRYFIAVVLAVIVGFILSIISGILLIVLLAGIFVYFYTSVVTFYLVARGCGPQLTDGMQSAEQPATESVEY